MSNVTAALQVINGAISVIDAALMLAGNAQKYRAVVARAIAEGRDLTDAELAELRADAQAAVDRLGGEA